MLEVTRREYKVMLDQRMFEDRKRAAASLGEDLHSLARRLKSVECDGEFDNTKKRQITFLDTRDNTIALNRFVLRQRVDLEKSRTEYTLKCRSPDRYVAAGANVEGAEGLEQETKFEEDIGAPFVTRFSHSSTVIGPADPPERLRDAAKLFPALGDLKRDGEPCADEIRLWPVNATSVYERVLAGPTLKFGKTEAEIALILWSDGPQGRPLVAEFSFRYEHDKERFSAKTATAAMNFFGELQRLDWCSTTARTKTQFVYAE